MISLYYLYYVLVGAVLLPICTITLLDIYKELRTYDDYIIREFKATQELQQQAASILGRFISLVFLCRFSSWKNL